MRFRLAFHLYLIALTGFLVPLCGCDGAPQDDLSHPGQKADLNFRMVDLEGVTRSADSLQGEVIFLNLWATWCPPCRSELPAIDHLYNDYGEKVKFVLLSRENLSLLRDFTAKNDITAPVYSLADSLTDSFSGRYIPRTYIIDRNGAIVRSVEGGHDWNNKDTRDLLDGLIQASRNDDDKA